MRTRIRVVAVVAMVAVAAAGCGSVGGDDEGGGGSEGAITVGLVIPQSGVYAPLGEDMQAGWDLYLEQNGGQIGGRDVTTRVSDEGETPDSGVPAVQRMLQDGEIEVVAGIVNSAVALGSADAVSQAEKVLIVANAGANDITTAENPFIWRTSFTNGQVGYATGQYAAGALEGDKTAYVAAPDYAAGAEQTAGMVAGFEEGGGTVVDEGTTPFGTTQDFQPFLGGIRDADAAATLAFYAGGEAVSFVQQYDQFGLKRQRPLYGTGFLTEGGVLEAQGAAADGVRTAQSYAPDLENPVNEEFAAAYEEAAGRPPTVYAVQMYDVAVVLDQALQGGGSTDGSELSQALGELGEIDSPRGKWTFENKSPRQTYYGREVTREGGAATNAVVEELGEFGPDPGE